MDFQMKEKRHKYQQAKSRIKAPPRTETRKNLKPPTALQKMFSTTILTRPFFKNFTNPKRKSTEETATGFWKQQTYAAGKKQPF